MPKIEQNGEGFKYVITYRRTDGEYNDQTFTVDDAEAWHQIFELNNVPSYTPYNVTVKAINSEGDSNATLEMVRGFSGEDSKKISPNSTFKM